MSYPTILKTLQHLRDNSEMPQREVTESELLDTMKVDYGPDWLRFEGLLAKLPAEDLETLCIGDEEEQVSVLAKLDGEDRKFTWDALCHLWGTYTVMS